MLHGVRQVIDWNAGSEDFKHNNHDENQHAPAGANSLRRNERRAQRPLTRRPTGRWLSREIFRIYSSFFCLSSFCLPVKTVHGVPLLAAAG
jgi:hypothetical protein